MVGLAGSYGSADGTGSTARFNNPFGAAVDSVGNLYVADTGNNAIREVTPGGAVSTLAGSPGDPGSTDGIGGAARFYNPEGVAVDAAGNLYASNKLWIDVPYAGSYRDANQQFLTLIRAGLPILGSLNMLAKGQKDAQASTQGRKQQTFGQQLLNQANPWGTQSQPGSNFPVPPRGSRQ